MLSDVAVLVTRPTEVASSTIEVFSKLDAEAWHAPVLEIQSVEIDLDCDISELQSLIFVSRHAVLHSAGLFRGIDKHAVDMLAVGAATAALLRAKYSVSVNTPVVGMGGKALLTSYPPSYWRARRVGVVRGMGAPEELLDELRILNAQAFALNVYKRQRNHSSQAQLFKFVHARPPPALKIVTVFSSDSLRALVELAEDNYSELSQLPLLVISNAIARRARKLSWTGPIEVAQSTEEQALCDAMERLLG
ncbi:MAG: uroporphyrinogen-III synthase [Proteobacteria bacterium]|jgi:uroporphyrinogen-III synthase|nr:uroporphyrinogen-III synthase [Pseudomonadota bacterium]